MSLTGLAEQGGHTGLGVKHETGTVPGGEGRVLTLSCLSGLRPAEGRRRPWHRPQGKPILAWTSDWWGEGGDPSPSLPPGALVPLPAGPPLLCPVTLVHVPSSAFCADNPRPAQPLTVVRTLPADPAVQVTPRAPGHTHTPPMGAPLPCRPWTLPILGRQSARVVQTLFVLIRDGVHVQVLQGVQSP